jgi:hypothetical protein
MILRRVWMVRELDDSQLQKPLYVSIRTPAPSLLPFTEANPIRSFSLSPGLGKGTF